MRIWSIHPKYLDSKGLVALWRETLLAKHVLEGRTVGYRHHPQLRRFSSCSEPLLAINQYLNEVYKQALSRQYNFDSSKFKKSSRPLALTVTEEQVKYEFEHLLKKLKSRDIRQYKSIRSTGKIDVHPIFRIIPGPIESWESKPL
jgi:hypothetical protein